MHQLATEGGRFGPGGYGVPGADDNNKKTYVYDIDHRSNQCIAVAKLQSIVGISIGDVDICPVTTGAKVSSVAGGLLRGYDMYGQWQEETVGAAGTSVACYSQIISGPADGLWVDEFGLPYKWAAGASAGDITYVAPTGINERGSFTFGGTFPAEVAHDYTVERDNMFGDNSANFASGSAIADVTMNATIDANGLISLTKTLVADGSSWIRLSYDDNNRRSTPNEAGTVNQQLDPWYLSTRRGLILGIAQSGQLMDGITENGTKIIINLTGVEPTGAGVPDPISADEIQGPYTMSDGGKFWLSTTRQLVLFDADGDPDPDFGVPYTTIVVDEHLSDESKLAIHTKLVELTGSGLPGYTPPPLDA